MRMDNGIRNRTTLLLLLVLCVFVGYQAAATKAIFASPTSVAVVQLKKVMDSIQQRAARDVKLEELKAKSLEEEAVHKKTIDDLREKIRTLVGNDADRAKQLALMEDPEYGKLTADLELAALNYVAWQQFTLDRVDLEKSLIVQDLYRSVKNAISQLSVAQGYDIVLIDDSQGELTVNPELKVARYDQLIQQVSLRKILYTNPAVDITEEVITRMNNSFNAGAKP